MPEPPSGIDPELLAALIDGKLTEPRRSELLAQLARSPEDLALAADVAAVAREIEPGVTPLAARAPRRRWGARHTGWLALAAGLVGITTLTLARRDDAVRPLPAGISFSFPQWQTTTRGDSVALDTVPLSWRVGTRLADLRAAIAARDSAHVVTFARELEAMLATANAGLSSQIFAAVAARAGNVSGNREQLDSLTRLGARGLTRRVDPGIVSVASWLESIRIEAHRGSPGGVARNAVDDPEMTRLSQIAPQTAAPIRESIAAGRWDAVRRDVGAALDTLGR